MCFILLLAALAQGFDQPRIFRLDNGLRVVIVEDRTTPAVSVQLWYRVGSSLDHPSRPGLCHIARSFWEHRDSLAARIRACGGRFESRTLPDANYFATILPPELLDVVLKLELQRLQPIDKSRINVPLAIQNAARPALVAEPDPSARSGSRVGGVRSRSFDTVAAAAFPDHPRSRLPSYVAPSLAKLTPDELADLLNRWFVPGNATLFIIGNIEALPTEDLVRRRFSKLKWREPPRPAAATRPEKVEVLLHDQPAGRGGVDFAWVTLPWGYFENAAIDVLMHALCNPVDGTLTQRLQLAGIARPRFTRFAWNQSGLLVLSVDTSPDRRADAERIIRDALANAQNELPAVAQLNRAVTAASRHVALRRTTFRRRAMQLAAHEIIGGDMLLAATESLRYERVSAGDVQTAAARLSRLRRVVLTRTAGDPRPLPPRFVSSPAQRVTGERGLAILAALPDANEHATIAERPETAPWAVEQLGDHLTVALRWIPGAEDATVTTTVEPPFGSSLTALHALMQGTAECDAGCLQDYLSYHGIKLTPFSDGRRYGLSAVGPSSRLPQMIEWQAKLFQMPNTSAAALNAAFASARDGRARLMADRAALSDYLADMARASITPRLPSAEVPPDELRRLLDRVRTAAHVEVTVSGGFERGAVLANVLRNWLDTDRPPPAAVNGSKPPPSDENPGVQVYWQTRAGSQVQVRIVVRGVTMAGQSFGIDTARRMIGPPNEQMADIDAGHAWLWRCRAVDPSTLLAAARTTATELIEDLKAVLHSLRGLRSGSVAPAQTRLASRLARADRVTAPQESLGRSTAGAGGRNAEWGISIIVVGGDETLSESLQALGQLHRLATP